MTGSQFYLAALHAFSEIIPDHRQPSRGGRDAGARGGVKQVEAEGAHRAGGRRCPGEDLWCCAAASSFSSSGRGMCTSAPEHPLFKEISDLNTLNAFICNSTLSIFTGNCLEIYKNYFKKFTGS